jgi:UDP-glucose 4-epimerase
VVAKYFPASIACYARNGWLLPQSIDRVYRSDKAMRLLNYQPKYTFEFLLQEQLIEG